jgi:hypothetical protein
MSATDGYRATRRHKSPPIGVEFPVMAFQLLAFFILTFQAPTTETHLDLYLPAAPLALPGSNLGQSKEPLPRRADFDLENDLLIRAEADDVGDLKRLTLGEAPMESLDRLTQKLSQYAALMKGRPLRVRLLADDRLRYEEAARIVGACSTVGVAAIRLSGPVAIRGG